jgi:hypothetical protein
MKPEEPSLEDYLSASHFNVDVYEALEKNKDLFEPLEFFNLLYGEYDFFEANQENYLLIREAYKKIVLEDKQLYFFLESLVKLIKRKHYSFDDGMMLFKGVGEKSLGYLQTKLEEIDKKILAEDEEFRNIEQSEIRFINESNEAEKTLDDYLINAFNINIYQDLTKDKRWSGLFDPLYFFKLLYSNLDFFEVKKGNYLVIQNHYDSIQQYDLEAHYYFLGTLIALIEATYYINQFSEVEFQSYQCIKRAFHDIYDPTTPMIEEKQSTKEESGITRDSEDQLKGYSNSQLVLMFYYFLKGSGLEVRRDINVATTAKFIHLITGKEFTKIQNSEFNKKLQKVPNFKSDKELIKDLEVIKPLFQKVELNDIVKLIDAEIEIAKREDKPAPK